MKNKISTILLLIVVIGFSACNDKLNIAAPYKNITVVYGLLNIADTAHYIRIQKAFMDENKSAIDMAKVADSSFYGALKVSVKEISAAGVLLNTIALDKVDLLNEGYPKDQGAFFNTPSYAYKFKYPLNKDNTYRLIILNTQTGNIDSASTPIIDNTLPISSFGIREWLAPKFSFNFPKEYTVDGKIDQVKYSVSIPPNVGSAELIVRFNWTDSNTVTKAAVHKSADFTLFTQTTTPEFTPQSIVQTFEVGTVNKNLYDFIRNAVGTNLEGNLYHYLDSCDMYLYVAGLEYRRYKDLNSTKGGLTADEIRPVYTNIKGKDVMGLYSTRAYTQRLQVPIGQETRDSILTNTQTRGLNIRFYP